MPLSFNSFNITLSFLIFVGLKAFDILAVGNMRHLIVEACIARKLIDTSAYFWPGYVAVSATSLTDSSLVQVSPWSTFMEGSQLTDALKNALIATPASRYFVLCEMFT